jgi:hypothetical protein
MVSPDELKNAVPDCPQRILSLYTLTNKRADRTNDLSVTADTQKAIFVVPRAAIFTIHNIVFCL